MKRWQLITENPHAICDRISKENNFDGRGTHGPFDCDDERIFNIADKDKYLLTDAEQDKLIPFEPPVEKEP